MINIITRKLEIESELKKKIEVICYFCNTKPTIPNENIDKIKKYVEQFNDTTSNLREANDINIILKKYENDLG